MSNTVTLNKQGKLRTNSKSSVLFKVAMLLVFLGLVIVPIVRMLVYITPESITKIFTSQTFGTVALNSLTVSVTATLITVALAYGLAYCFERTGIKFKGIFGAILVLPMLIPSISHGMGLVLLFGNNGIITRLLNLEASIYGFWGIVTGSVLYAFPVAFLMISDVMKYEDHSPYEAATVLGVSKWRQFASISLPFLRKPLISVFFAVFTMIITDYGVPLTVGGKYNTLSVVMYQEVIGRLDYSSGSVYGAILLIPAVIAFIIDLVNKDRGNSAFVIKPFIPSKNRLTLTASYLYTSLMSLFTLLPIASFIILGFTKKYPINKSFTLKNLQYVFSRNGDDYLVNSIVIALAVAILGTALGFAAAYLTARSKTILSKFLHLISITAMAVPGIVLGLAYVLLFKGSIIYGTLIIIIMANLVHFVSSPYLMMYNSLGKINSEIESVGETLGISKLRLIKDVFIPQNLSTLAEMFTYFFVNSMMTISAVSFLAKNNTKPISLMINQFNDLSQLENAAIVSLAILIINLIIKGLVGLLKKKLNAR